MKYPSFNAARPPDIGVTLCEMQGFELNLCKNNLGNHNYDYAKKQNANVTSSLAWSINCAHSLIYDMISVSGRSSMLSVL